MTKTNTVLQTIKTALLEDEREYCFDRDYTSDQEWEEQNGTETREEAFAKLQDWVTTATLKDIEKQYGDKYSYLR